MSTSELSALDLLNLFGVFLQAMNYQSDLSQASNADIAKHLQEQDLSLIHISEPTRH